MAAKDNVVYSRFNGMQFALPTPKNEFGLLANMAIRNAAEGNLFEAHRPRVLGVNIKDGMIVKEDADDEVAPMTDLERAAQRIAEREAKQAEAARKVLQEAEAAKPSDKQRKALAEIAAAVKAKQAGDGE